MLFKRIQKCARATSHFKAAFASDDVANKFPFDAQAEIGVFSKVGAYLLTSHAGSVEAGLRKIKPAEKDAADVEKIKHCLTVAAAEREDRYKSMSEFCYDMNARQPMTPDQRQALHKIHDAFKRAPLENDIAALTAHVRVLEAGEVQLAVEPLKAMREMMQGVCAYILPEIEQSVALQQLDATLAHTIGTLEKNEAGIIQELERIEKERDREFREEESVTAGDEIILAFLDHPSDRVRAAAVRTSSITHRNRKLIPCTERVIAKAREVLLGSCKTEYPNEWKSLWGWYTLQRSELGRGFLTKDILEDRTAEKDLLVRMVGEKVDHIERVFSVLKDLVFDFSKEDVIKISSIALQKLKSLQEAFQEGRDLYKDSEMADAYGKILPLYELLCSKVEQTINLSELDPVSREEIVKTQEGIADFLLQYSFSQSLGWLMDLSTPFRFWGHNSENKLTKEWDPTQVSRIMNGIAEAPLNSLFSCSTWVATNMLRYGYITTTTAVKVLRRLVIDGHKLTDFDCKVLESAYTKPGTTDSATIAEFLLENMTDPKVNSALESPRLAPIVKRKVADLRKRLIELGSDNPGAGHEIHQILSEISACLKNNQSSRDQTEKITVDEYMKVGQITAAVDLAVDVLGFDGKFLTQLLKDVFEALKKDPQAQSKYKLFPFKKRGTKYFLAGTDFDQLLKRIIDRVIQQNDRTQYERAGGMDAFYSFHHYLLVLPRVCEEISDECADPEQSAFVKQWKKDPQIFTPNFDAEYH